MSVNSHAPLAQMKTHASTATRLGASALLVVLLSACAASVERVPPSASAPASTSGSGAAAAPSSGVADAAAKAQPSLKIPAASAKRLVMNIQLEPPHAKDAGWASFRQEWLDIAKEQATTQTVAFQAQDADAKPLGEAGTLVVVRVKDYKTVSIAARVMLGVFTGNAYIEAKVEYRDLATGALYGEREYNTRSNGWQGVFAAVTSKQLYALSDEILGEMKQR
jgi:hypothetical protein